MAIKGITIKFLSDDSDVKKSFKSLRTSSKEINKDLRAVNKALKFDPTNVTLLKQKQDILNRAIKQTEQDLKGQQAQLKQMDASGVSKTSREYQALQRKIIDTERNLEGFKNELKTVSAPNLTAIGEQFKSIGDKMKTAGTQMSIGAGIMVAAGKQLLEANSVQTQAENKLKEIYKTRMGATEQAANATIKYAGVLQQSGIIGDEVTLSGAQQLATFAKYPSTVNKLLPAMDNLLTQQKGYSATADDATSIANLMGKALMGNTGALTRVGISFTDAQAKVLKYGTEEEKAATLAEVINQNVGHMNKTLANTPEGKIAQAKNTLGDLGEQLGAVILPAIADIAKWLSDNVLPVLQNIIDYVQAHPMFGKIAVGIAAVMAVGGPLLIFIGSLFTAIGSITTAFGALNLSMLPIIAVIAAIIAIGVLLVTHWDQVKAKAKSIWEGIKNIFSTVMNAIKNVIETVWNGIAGFLSGIWNGIKSAASAVWNGIKTVIITPVKTVVNLVKSAFNGLKGFLSGAWNDIKNVASSVWNGIKSAITRPIEAAKNFVHDMIEKIKGFFHFKWKLPDLKLPHIRIKGRFSISPPSAPHFSIKWYKKALDHPYMLDGATIFGASGGSLLGGGEAGREMIIGESTFRSMVADAVNMQPVVDAINQRPAASINIVVNAAPGQDEKTIAQKVAEVLQTQMMREGAAF